MRNERNQLVVVFTIFTFSYILRTVYFFTSEQWRKLDAFCSQFTRWIFISFLQMLWDIPPVAAVMYLHWNNNQKMQRLDRTVSNYNIHNLPNISFQDTEETLVEESMEFEPEQLSNYDLYRRTNF